MPTRPTLSKEDFLAKLAQIEAAMQAESPDQPAPSAAPPSPSCRLQGPLNQFAFDLFGQRLQEPKTGNALISPASIALALGMVLTGTVDPVETDMRKVLHASTLSADEINHCFASLQRHLAQSGEGVILSIANSLWSALGQVTLLPGFVQACRSTFNAEAATLDFSAPETLAIINDWVNDHTQGKIPSIITQSQLAMSILILINALYFKGRWQTPFNPELTRDGSFQLGDGTRIQTPMMSRLDDYLIHEDGQMRVVRLPYGKAGRFGMVILVPGEGVSLSQLTAGLNSRVWYELMGKLHPRRVNLILPRFQLDDGWNLVKPLKSLGMASAFEDATGFQRMVAGPAVIGDAIHKVFMEVNEEGTEAAAATAILMTRSLPQPFAVDRPFALVIHDEETGAILFLGQVVDPR